MIQKTIRAKLAHLQIQSKIQLIFVPPLVIVLLFVVATLFGNAQKIHSANRVVETVELVSVLDAVAHNFAVERGLTAGFLGSKGEKGKDKLEKQRDKADAAKQHFLSTYDSKFNGLHDSVKPLFDEIKNQLSRVDELRISVDQVSAVNNPFGFYSSLNKLSLDAISILASRLQNPKTIREINALTAMLWMKERSGQERGALNGVFASGKFSARKVTSINLFIADQSTQEERIAFNADSKTYSEFKKSIQDESHKKVIAYRETFFNAVNNNLDLNENAQTWFKVSTDRIKNIKAFSDNASKTIKQSAQKTLVGAWTLLILTLAISVIGTLGIIILSKTISMQLQENIRALITGINQVRDDKNFGIRVNILSQDELGDSGKAFNTLMDQLQSAIGSVNDVMGAVAKGKFSARIQTEFDGDLNTLKESVNHSAEKVDSTMTALEQVMSALASGDFSARMSPKVEGEFKQKVDGAMESVDTAIQSVSSIMKALSEGDFSKRIQAPLKGSLDELKHNVNSSVANIEKAFNAINATLQAQANGKFDTRITEQYHGDLLTLCNNVNRSMESLDDAMKEIAEVFSSVNAGDFSRRITRDLSGDLNGMKNNINTSLAQLDKAIDEIVAVANAQKEGDLDQRINGVYLGQLKDLTDSLNHSGEVLSDTFQRITSVMQTMQEGNFDQRIDSPLNGTFEILRNAINDTVLSLENAVKDIMSFANAQNQGNMNERMHSDYQGQLNSISQAMNGSMANLVNIIQDVQSASKHALSMSAEQAQGATDMSRRTEAQAAALEEVASTMEQISATVANTENDCNKMAEQVGMAKSVTESTKGTVESTVKAMSQMRSSSQEIAKITGMIDEIAFQTNLLALNAAVEAARAGEQGRGFAVVASEVRNLAQRSSDAAKNIKSLIEENLDNVEENYGLTQQFTKDLTEISDVVNAAFDLTQSVTNAAQEQARGVKEVNSAISSLDGMTQENAAMVEETTAAAKSVEDQFLNVNRKLDFFKFE